MAIKVLMGTGHRPQHFPGGWDDYVGLNSELIEKVAKHIISLHKKHGVEKVITGMAQGWDTILAIAAIRARKSVPIKLHAALPCKGQDTKWSKKAKTLYAQLLKDADQVEYVFDGRYEQNRNCMHDRDEYMVKNSDAILAYYVNLPYGLHDAASMEIPAEDKGGTVYTLRFAKKWAIKNNLHIPVFNYCNSYKQNGEEKCSDPAKEKISPYPDPLKICPIDPHDFRFDPATNQWVHDPGWWRKLRPQSKKYS